MIFGSTAGRGGYSYLADTYLTVPPLESYFLLPELYSTDSTFLILDLTLSTLTCVIYGNYASACIFSDMI